MTHVRALAVAGPDQAAAVQEVDIPEPVAGQVRVRTAAASINGIDRSLAAGHLWGMPHTFPVVVGRDFAGVVDRVGDDVTSLAEGDRVAGVYTAMDLHVGTVAEAVTIEAGLVVPIPDAVTAEQAAATGLAAVTALDLVDALKLTADDVVLVSGATGGVGTFAVQLAAATGAAVLGTAATDEAAQTLRSLGATATVDHTGDLASAVRKVAPQGITAVVHAAGAAGALFPLLAPGGRFASALGATQDQSGRDDITVAPVLAQATRDKLTALLGQVAAGRCRPGSPRPTRWPRPPMRWPHSAATRSARSSSLLAEVGLLTR